MDKQSPTKRKGIQFNLMVIVSMLMLIPASSIISNQMHWTTPAAAPKLGLPAPAGKPLAVSTPQVAASTPREVEDLKAAEMPQRRQRTQVLTDGNSVQESFDGKGQRLSKLLTNPSGGLLNRWDFEPASGRILRFETREYQGADVPMRRVAHWRYSGGGAFVKTNFIFEPGTKFSKSFVESVSDKRIKYQERWYDSKRRLVSEKNWNPENGKFVSFFMTTYGLGGWATQTSMDERGNELHKQLLTPSGKNVTKIGRVQTGK